MKDDLLERMPGLGPGFEYKIVESSPRDVMMVVESKSGERTMMLALGTASSIEYSDDMVVEAAELMQLTVKCAKMLAYEDRKKIK